MSANPHANGGLLLRDLRMPDFRDYAVQVDEPGTGAVESTRVLGRVPARRDGAQHATTFRVFRPDENSSNRLQDVLEVTDRTWNAETLPDDDHLAVDGRVMEILSEHTCEGWLEGYLLTGRHGLLLLLRGVHPRHRLDVQPARQVAAGPPTASRGGDRSRR